jgi:hypothetical protein
MGFKKQVYQIDLRSHLPFVRVNGFQRQVCCIGLGSYLFDLSFEGRQKVSVLKSPGFWSPCLCAEPVSESRGILNIPEFSFFFGAESGRQGFFPFRDGFSLCSGRLCSMPVPSGNGQMPSMNFPKRHQKIQKACICWTFLVCNLRFCALAYSQCALPCWDRYAFFILGACWIYFGRSGNNSFFLV